MEQPRPFLSGYTFIVKIEPYHALSFLTFLPLCDFFWNIPDYPYEVINPKQNRNQRQQRCGLDTELPQNNTENRNPYTFNNAAFMSVPPLRGSTLGEYVELAMIEHKRTLALDLNHDRVVFGSPQ